MKAVLIPVLLSALVWPGAGQIYNRDFKKGIVLILLTFLAGLSLFMVAGMQIAQHLPPDVSSIDTARAQAIADEILKKNAGFFASFNILVLATWVFGVIDAFLGAKERLNAPPAPEASTPE